ncbi:hypothetical protein C8Q76DRAFT_790774 [Earliella scabrosa]|nr:hypothetical protein C8Q76DRAFT_790774 [Earliella scabrosa]
MNSFPTTIDRSISANVGVPVERSSGLLQPLNTNRKTAKMPLTFIRHFDIGASLRPHTWTKK